MSDDVSSTVSDSETTEILGTIRLLHHLKEYGVVYAIAYFVAQDVGLLTTLASTAGGIC